MRALAVIFVVLGAPVLADGHVGSKGYVGEQYGTKGYVPPVRTHAPRAHVPTYHKPAPRKFVTLPPCPAGYTGMYRGTLYCIEGRLSH